MNFCSSTQRQTVPTSESTLLLFVSHLAKSSLGHGTIKVYLSAVRHMHVSCGKHTEFSTQLSPRLQQVIKGIKKTQSALKVPNLRRPITLDIMTKIKAVLSGQPKSHLNVMLWAACCLAFFGFLRCSEFTVPQQGSYDKTVHLSTSDVAVDCRSSPTTIRVHIKQSKTDPFRQGVHIYLGKTDQNICPVAAIVPYLTIRGTAPGPLLIFENGRMVTRQLFKSAIDSVLSQLHLNKGNFNTHSFRIGAATSAINSGIPAVQVKMLGRWKSDAYQRYVRTSPKELAMLSKTMATHKAPCK